MGVGNCGVQQIVPIQHTNDTCKHALPRHSCNMLMLHATCDAQCLLGQATHPAVNASLINWKSVLTYSV